MEVCPRLGLVSNGIARCTCVQCMERAIAQRPPGVVTARAEWVGYSEPDAPDEKVKVHKVACAVCMRDFEAHDTKHLQAAFSQHMTDGTCKPRGSSDDAAREQSMRETAAKAAPPRHEVLRMSRRLLFTEDAVFSLPTEDLPRVVRELAALMTEEQAAGLAGELGARYLRYLDGGGAKLEALNAYDRETWKHVPVVLDEDLLCGDE